LPAGVRAKGSPGRMSVGALDVPRDCRAAT
jgi:hypothetical protein